MLAVVNCSRASLPVGKFSGLSLYRPFWLSSLRRPISTTPMAAPPPSTPQNLQYQNVVVMRHGDRLDNFEPLWVSTAARPWDPPLVETGKIRAFCTGRKLRTSLPFRIDRVFVSPFLRCVQTAAEAIAALCAVDDDSKANSKDEVSIDPSKLKASIEYGLCEMLNTQAIRPPLAPKDGNFAFNLSEIEAMLPAEVLDRIGERVYKELPKWEETVQGTRDRYKQIIQALADKYPSENLLLVTHGEGVGVSISAFLEGATVYEVDYCAYSHLRRPISGQDKTSTPGSFEVVTAQGQNGIEYMLSNIRSE